MDKHQKAIFLNIVQNDPKPIGNIVLKLCGCRFCEALGIDDCEENNTPCTNYINDFFEQFLNNRRAQPENKPLTLDELKQMDGEPVWLETGEISISEKIIGRWEIVKGADGGYNPDLFYFRDVAYYINNYGKTWLAYRRKPEGMDK